MGTGKGATTPAMIAGEHQAPRQDGHSTGRGLRDTRTLDSSCVNSWMEKAGWQSLVTESHVAPVEAEKITEVTRRTRLTNNTGVRVKICVPVFSAARHNRDGLTGGAHALCAQHRGLQLQNKKPLMPTPNKDPKDTGHNRVSPEGWEIPSNIHEEQWRPQ